MTSSKVKISIVATFAYVTLYSILPVLKLVPEYRFYEGNLVCAYNFAPGEGGMLHRVVVGLIGAQGLGSVLVVLFFNISIIVSVGIEVFCIDVN